MAVIRISASRSPEMGSRQWSKATSTSHKPGLGEKHVSGDQGLCPISLRWMSRTMSSRSSVSEGRVVSRSSWTSINERKWCFWSWYLSIHSSIR